MIFHKYICRNIWLHTIIYTHTFSVRLRLSKARNSCTWYILKTARYYSYLYTTASFLSFITSSYNSYNYSYFLCRYIVYWFNLIAAITVHSLLNWKKKLLWNSRDVQQYKRSNVLFTLYLLFGLLTHMYNNNNG